MHQIRAEQDPVKHCQSVETETLSYFPPNRLYYDIITERAIEVAK